MLKKIKYLYHMNSKKWVMTFSWIFHLLQIIFTEKIFKKFISQMGNTQVVYETNYKANKVKNLLLGKVWHPSDLLSQDRSYCTSSVSKTLVKNFWLTSPCAGKIPSVLTSNMCCSLSGDISNLSRSASHC